VTTDPGAGQKVDSRSSVVICSRNRPELLSDAVRAVLSMRTVPAELVVVDQSDRAHPDLRGLPAPDGVRLLHVPSAERGLSRARNLGVSTASGDVLAFLDDDVLPEPDWLEAITDALRAGGPRHVVTGRVDAGRPEVPGAWAPSVISDTRAHSYRGRQRQDVIYPHNMAMFREALDVIGTFDERLGTGSPFPSAEDNDFCYRLLVAGFTVDYHPAAVVTHRAWRDEGALSSLKMAYGRGQGAFYAKYILRRDWFMLVRLLDDLGRHAIRGVRRWQRRDRDGARADLAYTCGLLRGALAWARTRP
jgi:GT2 family glycosyltransferase